MSALFTNSIFNYSRARECAVEPSCRSPRKSPRGTPTRTRPSQGTKFCLRTWPGWIDLLDRLDEELGTAPPAASHAVAVAGVSAPKAKLDLSGVPGVAQLAVNPLTGVRTNDELAETRAKREEAEKREHELSAELQSLEDMQKNQAHPLNLVAVKQSGTPVMARAAEGSRILFTASTGDEFEFLDAEGPWLHVGISGVSRGYIKRGSVEYSDFVASRLKSQDAAEAATAKAAAFRVEREETSLFPGDWESLKGKKVKIYTVQPVSAEWRRKSIRRRNWRSRRRCLKIFRRMRSRRWKAWW